jgi:hypothetical protein
MGLEEYQPQRLNPKVASAQAGLHWYERIYSTEAQKMTKVKNAELELNLCDERPFATVGGRGRTCRVLSYSTFIKGWYIARAGRTSMSYRSYAVAVVVFIV